MVVDSQHPCIAKPLVCEKGSKIRAQPLLSSGSKPCSARPSTHAMLSSTSVPSQQVSIVFANGGNPDLLGSLVHA